MMMAKETQETTEHLVMSQYYFRSVVCYFMYKISLCYVAFFVHSFSCRLGYVDCIVLSNDGCSI